MSLGKYLLQHTPEHASSGTTRTEVHGGRTLDAKTHHPIEELNEEGFSVQLNFLEDVKDRDLVPILSESGKEIVFHPDMQHNRNCGALRKNTANMIEAVEKALGEPDKSASGG
eukprot:3106801-Rhodomonas_salina.1